MSTEEVSPATMPPGGPCVRNLRNMDDASRKEYWATLALRHCRGLGARSICRLLETFGSAYAAVQARKRWREAGVREDKAAALACGSWRVTAEEEWNKALGLDALVLFWSDEQYPQLLRGLPDAPALLYCRGDLSLLKNPAIAVVGSRKASKNGLDVAAYMARSLAICGLTIVSGMALGIDSRAHEAALRCVGRSIGVLGTGIDVLYPRRNLPVFAQMERQGLLLSEFAPGTPAQGVNFPIRNRIISGLSLAVLVVEAAEHSGSLITARLALEQNREVFAVPGPALSAQCRGSQDLVRQGARAVFSADDVLLELAEQLRPYGLKATKLLEEVKASMADDNDKEEAKPERRKSRGRRTEALLKKRKQDAEQAPLLSQGEQVAARQLGSDGQKDSILEYLRHHGSAHADELAASVGMDASSANATLVGMEMLGMVRRLPGARYEVAR